ncbi:MAG: hypothetical protein F6K62_13370 [Sphaerospermopsis sp. SIO1G2]|nr:hypothetical protein [Sphaerospermopsis sp. SIO1G2]
MNLNKDNKQSGFSIKTIYKFCGGATLGAFLVSLPILYGASTDLSLFQVCIALIVIISFGILSSIWGEKFVDAVMNVFNSSGL